MKKRIAASAHGLLVGAILPYGLLIDAMTAGRAASVAQLPVLLLLALAAASIIYSVWLLRDRPLIHFAHLVTIVLAVPLTFVSSVAVVGWT